MQVFVDPFHQGEVLFIEDCEARLGQIFGRPVAFRPEFAAAVSPKQLLARMLGNLKGIYIAQNEAVKAIAALDRLLMLLPNSLLDQRDRGLMYYRLGQWANARRDLKSYLEQAPTAKDAVSIQALLQRLQNAEADW
jgi:regulator of sirC expression with transglutaminase-like and TPR domain